MDVSAHKRYKAPLEDVDVDMEATEKPQPGLAMTPHKKDKFMSPIDSVITKVKNINEDMIQKNDKQLKML